MLNAKFEFFALNRVIVPEDDTPPDDFIADHQILDLVDDD